MPKNVETPAVNPGGEPHRPPATTPDADASAAGASSPGAAAGAGVAGPPGVSVLPTPTWWSFLVIGIAMGAILLGTSKISMSVAKTSGRNLTNEFRLADPTPAKSVGETASNTAAGPTATPAASECKIGSDAALQKHILKQRSQLVVLGDGNLDAAIEFGAYFYTNIVILAVFGLISLISLLVITKTGLGTANGNVIAIFLLSTGIGLTYQGFFGVFQHRKNVEANMHQSISYGQLVKQIDTYCVTGKVATTDPKESLDAIAKSSAPVAGAAKSPVTPIAEAKPTPPVQPSPKPPPFFVALELADFILYIDWKSRELQKLSILFDDKAVSSFTDSSRLTGL